MITSYKKIKDFKNMSSSQLSVFDFKTKNVYKLGDLLFREITASDNGLEVGSNNYIKKSNKIFMKAKAVQDYNFLPIINEETSEYIKPVAFYEMGLKKGDIIISKDSNIGEACILNQDYNDLMLSNAFYRLPINTNKLYIFSFIKSEYFKNQLDILAPKGATIRHAGKKFLECYIPFPTDKKIIEYITLLTQVIINVEESIIKKDKDIISIIDNELNNGCKQKNVNIETLKYSELMQLQRFDVGIFSDKYKLIKNFIENYKFGNSSLEELGYSITRGQNLQISSIGKSIYSDKSINNSFYQLVLSNSITNNMSFRTEMFLGSKKKLKKIKYGDIIFTCRGNLGRCFINCSSNDNIITNIDNVHICSNTSTVNNKVMVGCFLHYLKEKEYLKNISIQGSGADSFTKYHFDMIKIPNFPEEIEKKLTEVYCNNKVKELNMANFDNEIQKYGMFYLEKIKENIREEIKSCFNRIINDEHIEIKDRFKELILKIKNI